MKQEAKDKLLACTRGTQLGAIIACALGVERDAVPRFCGKAMLTSDGFIMCNFVDRDGFGHLGAFVGSLDDFDRNVVGVAAHCKLNADDRAMFFQVMDDWCGAAKSRRHA